MGILFQGHRQEAASSSTNSLVEVAPRVPFQPAGGVLSCGSTRLAMLSGLGGEGSLALQGMKV